jgi:hypothetical protein
VRKAENQPPSSADVTEAASLNPPEPYGPHRPVMGMLYLYYFVLKPCEMIGELHFLSLLSQILTSYWYLEFSQHTCAFTPISAFNFFSFPQLDNNILDTQACVLSKQS